jgi:hypothetical protein
MQPCRYRNTSGGKDLARHIFKGVDAGRVPFDEEFRLLLKSFQNLLEGFHFVQITRRKAAAFRALPGKRFISVVDGKPQGVCKVPVRLGAGTAAGGPFIAAAGCSTQPISV